MLKYSAVLYGGRRERSKYDVILSKGEGVRVYLLILLAEYHRICGVNRGK